MPKCRAYNPSDKAQLFFYRIGQFRVRVNRVFRISEQICYATVFRDDPFTHVPRGIAQGRFQQLCKQLYFSGLGCMRICPRYVAITRMSSCKYAHIPCVTPIA